MTIAVDFDGTIVEQHYPGIGRPIPFAIETLRQLVKDGHKIILWTVREGKRLDEAVEYLKQNGIELYAVNSEYPNASWNGGLSRKIKADIYIDDCNLGGLPDWSDIYTTISGQALIYDKSSQRHQSRHRRDHSQQHHNSDKASHYFFEWLKERCRDSRSKFNR
ncbi:MAG: hypothetical protein MJY58_07535 [Bacteroidaceae bacterium]|nr:hypothetical protein [Bacteroidaceae bacterium]